MNVVKKTVFIFVAVFCLMPVGFVDAGIVPCGANKNDPNTSIDETQRCTICHLATGANEIIKALMRWMAYVAVVAIVAAGIAYIVSAGNQSMIGWAKAAIRNTVIGLVVILSAFLLIHFTLRVIAVNTMGAVTDSGNAWTFNCQ